MAISLKHTTVAVGTNAGNGEIAKEEWNEEHILTLATDRLLGRATAGAGAVEEITCTAAGRALLDDASASDQRTTLGLGTSSNPQFATIELGNASDTTITRSAAGVIAVEGGVVPKENRANTFTVNQIIEVTDNTNAALRITQLGTAAAIRVEDNTNPDSSPFVVDASGNVGIGTDAPTGKLDIITTGGGGASLFNRGEGVVQNGVLRYSTDATGPVILSRKGRGTIASPSAVSSADVMGVIRFSGYGGTTNRNLAEIQAVVDTYTSDSDISSYLAFSTSASGGITAAEKLRIAANGVLTSQPSYDNTVSGSELQVTSSGVIGRTSSSIKYKKDVEPLDHALADNAIDNLRPVWYRTKEPKGDDKSEWSHIGLIAEEVDKVEKRLVRYKTTEVSFVTEPVFDAKGQPVLDGDGNPETIERRIETPLANPVPEDVYYARLTVMLLDVVQRQKQAIAALEARVMALEV